MADHIEIYKTRSMPYVLVGDGYMKLHGEEVQEIVSEFYKEVRQCSG